MKNKKGFTLIELLAVIVILAIIMVIATMQVNKTIKKANYKGSSIVDGLKSVGVNSSYDNRKKIAQANGIKNYTGTAKQNTELLNKLKKGTLKKAK